MKEKIEMLIKALDSQGINTRDYLIWAAEGINSFQDYSEYSTEQLAKMNIEFFEDESGEEYTEEEMNNELEIHIPMYLEEV
jgi:hypothetical protein